MTVKSFSEYTALNRTYTNVNTNPATIENILQKGRTYIEVLNNIQSLGEVNTTKETKFPNKRAYSDEETTHEKNTAETTNENSVFVTTHVRAADSILY